MNISIIKEYNENGYLLHVAELPGAYARGKVFPEAMSKIPTEIRRYEQWCGLEPDNTFFMKIVEEKESSLNVADADSDVLFESEREPLTREEYDALKTLCLRSAEDFLTMYSAVSDKKKVLREARDTFYGKCPSTAEEIYDHTAGVCSYYFGEIGVKACGGDILDARKAAFEALEKTPDFLENKVFAGQGNEEWTLRKLCRRFIWHDRIHAKSLYRLVTAAEGEDALPDPFCFGKAKYAYNIVTFI